MRAVAGSRGSKLALEQTKRAVELFERLFGFKVEVKVIRTRGDKILDSPLSQIPGKGFFVKEIEQELAKGTIDFAVHSLKDVPTELPEGLELVAFLERDDPADCLVGATPWMIRERIARGEEVVVGTSSLRKQRMFAKFFGNSVKFVPIRGNVDTRIRKLERGQCDVLVLAFAGLERLGLLNKVVTFYLRPDIYLYAPGQGIIAIEMRRDSPLRKYAVALDHPATRVEGEVERRVIARVGGGCNIPLGIYCKVSGNSLKLKFEHYQRDTFFKKVFEIPEKLSKYLGAKFSDHQEHERFLKYLDDFANSVADEVAKGVERTN